MDHITMQYVYAWEVWHLCSEAFELNVQGPTTSDADSGGQGKEALTTWSLS